MSSRSKTQLGHPLRGTWGASWLALLRRARYWPAPLAFSALVAFVMQPAVCAWCGLEASAAAHSSRAGGWSRPPPRPAASVGAPAVTSGGPSGNTACCGSVRLSDNSKPPPAEFASLQFVFFLAPPPPSLDVFDRTVAYVVRAARHRPLDRITSYYTRTARLLL